MFLFSGGYEICAAPASGVHMDEGKAVCDYRPGGPPGRDRCSAMSSAIPHTRALQVARAAIRRDLRCLNMAIVIPSGELHAVSGNGQARALPASRRPTAGPACQPDRAVC